jgi:hypothetical protein
VKCCGVVVARPQGQSWAPPSSSELSVNTGTVPVLARSHASGVGVRAGSTVDRSVRDGAEPPYYSESGKAGHMGKGGSSFEREWRL